jgi:sporadic carbohydrate cluster 2OG-Fe(II) oxygenase
MTDTLSFELPEDQQRASAFLKKGYAVVPVENRKALHRIQGLVADTAAAYLKQPKPRNPTAFLNGIHKFVDVPQLNALRLDVINAIRQNDWFRPAYFSLVRDALGSLVGNELAMQRGIGLSVQLPNDDSSLLPVHCDVWDGDSTFEVVEWVPLVDCFKTKSMYILEIEKDRAMQARLKDFRDADAEALFRVIEKDVEYLEVPYGSVLIFSQTLMHGNRVNREPETRWSMNCRFKSALSPYADKKLGEFFEPITLRPVTRMALHYRFPEGFDE